MVVFPFVVLLYTTIPPHSEGSDALSLHYRKENIMFLSTQIIPNIISKQVLMYHHIGTCSVDKINEVNILVILFNIEMNDFYLWHSISGFNKTIELTISDVAQP